MHQLLVKLTVKVTKVSDRLTGAYRPKDLHRLRISIRRIRSLLKQVSDRNARHFRKTWGGTIGIPINRVPQLGRISSTVFYSQGYSGHGVNVTHLAGQIMADTVAGTFERFDVFANIKPIVIPGAHTFRYLKIWRWCLTPARRVPENVLDHAARGHHAVPFQFALVVNLHVEFLTRFAVRCFQ